MNSLISITYEGIPVECLSPGTRGIVLLLLYLAIDIQRYRELADHSTGE